MYHFSRNCVRTGRGGGSLGTIRVQTYTVRRQTLVPTQTGVSECVRMARGPKRNKYSGRKSGTAELATTGAATTIASYTRGRPRIGYTARGVSNYLEPSSGASINFGCISLPPLSVSTSPQRPFFPPFRLSLSPRSSFSAGRTVYRRDVGRFSDAFMFVFLVPVRSPSRPLNACAPTRTRQCSRTPERTHGHRYIHNPAVPDVENGRSRSVGSRVGNNGPLLTKGLPGQ